MSTGTVETGRAGVVVPEDTSAAGVAPMAARIRSGAADIRPSAMADPDDDLGPIIPRVDINPLRPTPPVPGGPGAGGPPRPPEGGGNNGDGNRERRERPSEGPEWWWPAKLDAAEWNRLERDYSKDDLRAMRLQRAIDCFEGELSCEERAEEENLVKGYFVFSQLKEIAPYSRLFGMPGRIIELQQTLRSLDKNTIKSYESNVQNRELGEVFTAELDSLDRNESRLAQIEAVLLKRNQDGSLVLDQNGQPELVDIQDRPRGFSEKMWRKRIKERQVLLTEVRSLKTSINQRAGSEEFLEGRVNDQGEIVVFGRKQIKQAIQDTQRLIDDETKRNELKERELIGDVSPQLEVDVEPQLLNEIVDGNLPSFSDTLRTVNEQRSLAPGSVDQALLERAEARLAWYFHTAKQLGLTTDLETASSRVYRKYRLLAEREGSQVDVLEFRKELKALEESNFERNPDGSIVDVPRVWTIRGLAARGRANQLLPGFDINKFVGIRASYLNNASLLMDYQIQRLLDPTMPQIQDLMMEGLIRRLPGEFNVLNEDVIISSGEQARSGERRVLFDDDGFRVRFVNITREDQIPEAIQQYVDHLINGSGAFDVQEIFQKMNQLGKAIIDASLRMSGEKISRNAVDSHRKKWANYRREAENQVYFYLTQWFARIVNMEAYSQIIEKWGDKEGDERMKRVPVMVKGLSGLALLKLKEDKNILMFRPEGHRGQLINDQITQRYIRAAREKVIVDELLEFRCLDPEKLAHLTSEDQYGELFVKRVSILSNTDARFQGLGLRDAVRIAEELYDSNPNQENKNLLKTAKVEFLEAERDARAALDFALQFYDTIGKSGKLGAPSISMDNRRRATLNGKEVEVEGDNVRVDDVTLYEKYAILKSFEDTAEQYVIRSDGKGFKLPDNYRLKPGEKVINVQDNIAQVRWRARMWSAGGTAWWKSGKREISVDIVDENGRKIILSDKDGNIIYEDDGNQSLLSRVSRALSTRTPKTLQRTFKLKKGFEDMGLTEDEFDAMVDAYKDLRKNGFVSKVGKIGGAVSTRARLLSVNGATSDGSEIRVPVVDQNGTPEMDWEGRSRTRIFRLKKGTVDLYEEVISFEEAIHENVAKPVLNNFLAVDFLGNNVFNNEIAVEEAAKGKIPWLAKVRDRLGMFGRKRVEVATPQKQMEQYMDLIESSRSFHAMASRMTYYLATRANINELSDSDKFPHINIHSVSGEHNHLYDDQTTFTPDNIIFGFPGLPLGVKRIQYLQAYWISDMRERVSRGGKLLPFVPIYLSSMDEEFSFDDPIEMISNMNNEPFDIYELWRFSYRSANAVAWRSAAEGGIDSKRHERTWGFFEKPYSDSDRLWKLFASFREPKVRLEKTEAISEETSGHKEDMVNALIEVMGRFKPIITITEDMLGQNRGAWGANSGYEELEKFAFRYLVWALSPDEANGNGRMQGGQEAYKTVSEIMQFLTEEGGYSPGVSVWQRAWEKLTPSHNARISSIAPKLTQKIQQYAAA